MSKLAKNCPSMQRNLNYVATGLHARTASLQIALHWLMPPLVTIKMIEEIFPIANEMSK